MKKIIDTLVFELEKSNESIFDLKKELAIFPSYTITKEDLKQNIREQFSEQIMLELDNDYETSNLKKSLLFKVKELFNQEKQNNTITKEKQDLYKELFNGIKNLDYDQFVDLYNKKEEGEKLTTTEENILSSVSKYITHTLKTTSPLFDKTKIHSNQFDLLGKYHLYETKYLKEVIQEYENIDPYRHDIKDRKHLDKYTKPFTLIHEPKGDMIATLFLIKTEQPEIFKQISSSYKNLAPNEQSTALIREMINCSNNIFSSPNISYVVKTTTHTLLKRTNIDLASSNKEESIKLSEKGLEVFNKWANRAANNGIISKEECIALIKCSKEEFSHEKLLNSENIKEFQNHDNSKKIKLR